MGVVGGANRVDARVPRGQLPPGSSVSRALSSDQPTDALAPGLGRLGGVQAALGWLKVAQNRVQSSTTTPSMRSKCFVLAVNKTSRFTMAVAAM